MDRDGGDGKDREARRREGREQWACTYVANFWLSTLTKESVLSQSKPVHSVERALMARSVRSMSANGSSAIRSSAWHTKAR